MEKQGILEHLPGLGPWGTSRRVGRTRGPSSVSSLPHYPYVFFHRDHKQLRQFPASLEVSMVLGVVSSHHQCGSDPDVEAPVSDPAPTPPMFHTDIPPLVTCFHIFFGLSLMLEWIFPPFISSFSLNPFFIISFQSSVFFLLL